MECDWWGESRVHEAGWVQEMFGKWVSLVYKLAPKGSHSARVFRMPTGSREVGGRSVLKVQQLFLNTCKLLQLEENRCAHWMILSLMLFSSEENSKDQFWLLLPSNSPCTPLNLCIWVHWTDYLISMLFLIIVQVTTYFDVARVSFFLNAFA